MADTLNVLFLAAEAEPFVKVGGLADVAGSLPVALRQINRSTNNGIKMDVRLILPLHSTINKNQYELHRVGEFFLAGRNTNYPALILKTYINDLPVYFVDGEPIVNSSSVYSTDPALDRIKYTFFSLAAMKLPELIEWQPDIIHANDWHTSMALYSLYSNRLFLRNGQTKKILTLHNLPYMGGDGTDILDEYALPRSADVRLPLWARTQPLPLGLSVADAIVPVSPTYAQEILTPEFGCGLQDFLQDRSEHIIGILNGIDQKAWNPETDSELHTNFGKSNLIERKQNKSALQNLLNLKVEDSVPLLAMIGRIDPQKGVEIAINALREIAHLPWQFIILGSGDPFLEKDALSLLTEFPERVRAEIRYDAHLSHMIYSAADILLMPSRYEPCGIAQMIAMRYGCVPVVHSTGGLKDTVKEAVTGFLFQQANTSSMVEALQRAFSVFNFPEVWNEVQIRCMSADFSWTKSAAEYARLYRTLSITDNSKQTGDSSYFMEK